MKEILNRLIAYKTLNENESKEILIRISNGELNNSQISSFLTVFMMRNITLEELKGFRNALLELCIKVSLEEFDAIDLCGTGGDGKDTFNISTLASFITAGSGCKVAKHGNYGVSSGCGSSNVLESLGLKFTNDYETLRNAIDKSGIYNYLLQKGNKKYSIIYSLDGYDEISLTNDTKIYSNNFERILKSKEFELENLKASEIKGGSDIPSSSKIFMNVLNGAGTESQNNVVCANAGIAISISKNISI